MGSTLGMMLDGVSDIVTNIPILFLFLIKTIKAINCGINYKRKVVLFIILCITTYAFSVIFGLNEAIENYIKNKIDNTNIYVKDYGKNLETFINNAKEKKGKTDVVLNEKYIQICIWNNCCCNYYNQLLRHLPHR